MFIRRPWANTDLDLTGAVLVTDGALPQTLSSLTAGSYELGRINWNATELVVTAVAAAPSVFHTQSGTGPYFRDPANAMPASTTRVEFEANVYIPAASTAATRNLFTQESSGITFELSSGNTIRFAVENGASTLMVSQATTGNTGLPYLLDQWVKYGLDVEQGVVGVTNSGYIRLYENSVLRWSYNWTPTADAAFQIGREISFLGTTTGTLLMVAGMQVEYAEAYFTTSGVRSLRKSVSGNAATVNADAWKLGTNAT